jgi:anti-sigma factor RsiW
MPAAIIMLASALILVVAALHRQGAGDGDSSLVAHLLETHRALESGELLPDMGSADAERVQRYLSRQTNLAVTVPSLAGFALTGGFTVLYGGSHAAHLVYRRDNTVLSIVQMSLEDILHGRGLLLPMNIRKELMHTGWYADSRENGMTLLFWTRGTMLCAAVGPVGRAELQGELSRSEGNAPTETPW